MKTINKQLIFQKYNQIKSYPELISVLSDDKNENKLLVEEFLDRIAGKFQPTFYWTGDLKNDAILINQPHVQEEWEQEDRIEETTKIFEIIKDYDGFERRDVLNIQNEYLKQNNYKWIESWIRKHGVWFSNSCPHTMIDELISYLFPVSIAWPEDLLNFYRRIQIIHPLSDLNWRVFGVIVAHLYNKYLQKK